MNRNHGKHEDAKQRRTQEKQASRPQEDEGGKAEEAPRLRARVKEAQDEEDGTRSGETVSHFRELGRAWA